MKLLIVIPAYNERENIERVVGNLIKNYPCYDYIVVNDGSKDATRDICRKNGYNLIDLPANLGLAGAFQTGLRYAKLYDYDAVLQFDADGQHLPQYIRNMEKCMEETDSDIVIGSRFVTVKKPRTLRMFGSYLISWAMTLTTGKRICDPTSGMRMFNRRMIEEFAADANFAPEPDTISFLLKNGASIQEVQVEMRERIAGESYLNLFNAAKYMIKMGVSIILIQWFRKRKEN